MKTAINTPKTTKATSKAATTLLLAGALLTLTACSSSSTQHAGDVGSYRSNPTPAMHKLAQRSSDRANMFSHTFDTNVRAMQGDIDRMLLFTNRPSRLHNNVKPY